MRRLSRRKGERGRRDKMRKLRRRKKIRVGRHLLGGGRGGKVEEG